MSAAEVIVLDPEAQDLQKQAVSLAERARHVLVTDQDSHNVGCEFLKGVAALRRVIVEHHGPLKKKTHDAHKEACAMEARQLAPVVDAETIIKQTIGRWETEQRRMREEAERRAREEAERLRDEMIEAAAVAAEAEGATAEEVAAIIGQPPPVVAPVPTPATFQRASGILSAQLWKAEVFDVQALCKAVSEGKASASLVQPNLVVLNQMARALKNTFNVPGVRAVPFDSLRVGGR